ncbi:CCAAT/enhancer-binding protein homolog 1 [Caenorhabditis elegans]|uniref:CCAAT/enhancer-binding protein homolog 1 n=1 Tax=Caenorhabditis elegans TaxID=6239 RepID=CEBP1_CAEEL|nr:CCAAT/enhancer-binding protein homolog 1 [Caenorhabditis elegans]Q18909.2 RecName: Full=CCAAT/enhancer-binding protein homolog 1 [Caenorhabditis elegans]CCD68278.2 CCAAT/enhancer-binding protein homolog 1 [Caenorhabditis elegans]|eukprot:NP_508276.2 C/EBP (CCAAT/enhancer-binding protein) homolog [Caenorhabditis elegans]
MYSKLNYSHQKGDQALKHPHLVRLQQSEVRGFTDMPNNGASTSSAGSFARQDSLTIAASLQQRDRERHPVDFMETELDLGDYLQVLHDLDVPTDNVDFDDAELQKCNILYDGEHPYEQPELNGYERHVAYGTGYRVPGDYDQDGYKMNCEVKAETPDFGATKTRRAVKRPVPYDDYQKEYSEESSDMTDNDGSVDDSYFEPKSKKTKSAGLENFKPQTRARKYKLKADEEKAEPTYKLKRARNNDAVRKSRKKAKELQDKKEAEHDKMKRRIAELEGLLQSERDARRRDQDTLEQLLRNKGPMKEQRMPQRHILENFNK